MAAALLGSPVAAVIDTSWAYSAVAAVIVVGYWVAFGVRRPQPHLPWVLIGLAVTGWAVADAVYTAIGGDPTVSIADAFYLLAYAGFIVGTGRFLARRTPDRDLDRAIDAMLIGIACFLFVWIGIVEPAWNEPGVSSAGRLMSALYPVLDVVVLFFLVRLLLAPGRPGTSSLLFVGAVIALLTADIGYAARQQTNSFADDPWNLSAGLWLVGYALMPVAVLLARDDHDGAEPASQSRRVGLLAAAIALLSLPVTAIVSHTNDEPVTTAVLTVAGTVVVLLVFVRYIRLHQSLERAFAEVERQQWYYRAVADNASDSFVIISPTGVVVDGAGTLRHLVGYDVDQALGANALDVVHPEDQELARTLLDDALAHPRTTVEGEVRVTTADGSCIWMQLHCTNLCDDPVIGGIVINAHDVSERKAVEAELERRALHDAVTGLANRTFLRDRIEEALLRRKTTGVDVAVLFCDLDGFKSVNDTIGHEAGDEMLRIAASRLAHSLRPADTLARLGGDEFAVLLESNGDLAAEADAIASRLLHAMAQPVEVRGTPLIVTASIGIAVASRGGEATPDDLLRDADTAMYAAKAAGRNRAMAYDPSMGTELLTRVQLGSDLRVAVERNELVLDYQPIVELATGKIRGFEALLRWNHPTRGRLTPERFIGIAEESGAILDIGRWVLDTACRDARSWSGDGTDPTGPVVSVNVSGAQLERPEFVAQVAHALTTSGLPAARLVIEITESTLVERTEPVAARLRALKAMGVHIAIDDFGVGQTSLSYLREFPVDVIKLDRSFVEGITDPDHVPALIGGLLELARTLEIQSLAEGIESPAQHEALTREGCELGQGYLFGPPVDPRSALRMLLADGAPEAPVGAP